MDKDIKWLSRDNGIEWGTIDCPMIEGEPVMTYYPEGVPCYYSYTAPFVKDGEVYFYRFDHDMGCWDESAMFFMEEYIEGTVYKFCE